MKTVKVVGQLFWAKHMAEPNVQFNPANDKYEICIGQLSDSIATRLTNELGIKIKERNDDQYNRGKHIVAKSKYVIKAVDEKGNEIDPSQIGNGTVAEVTLSSYEHRMSAMYGKAASVVHSPTIAAIKVKDLVAPPVAEAPKEQADAEELVL